nr:MAG TPA: hypothetical protein [Caudoviricetes sp.]
MGENRAIRDLNVVTIRWYGPSDIQDDNSEPTDYVFQAYLPEGFSFGFGNIVGSPNAELGNIASILANAVFDKVPAIDIPRWYMYKGSTPIKFDIRCYLKLIDDPIKDLSEPIQTLSRLTLPTRNKTNIRQTVANATADPNTGVDLLDGGIRQINAVAEGKKTFLGMNLSESGILNNAYLLNVPGPFRYAANQQGAVITFGKNNAFMLNEVMINSVQISVGRMLVDVGYPERIDLLISVETSRNATTDTIGNLFTAVVAQNQAKFKK